MRKTMEVFFSGKVQKVGFRACVKNAAQNFGLCGEVENLHDGRVRVLVTGDDMVIEKFFSMVYTCPRVILREVVALEYVLTEFPDFSVVRRE
jgi:acylphosphatase